MVMEDNESCASRLIFDALPASQATMDRRERIKMEVFDEVLRRLRQSDIEDAHLPGFEDDLWTHFNRLPARYALDVNVERAEDVLMHKRLLHSAYDPHNRPAIDVHLVQVQPAGISAHSDSPTNDAAHSSPTRKSIHPPPAFGSSPNLEALALAATISQDEDGDNSVHNNSLYSRPLHEITFSTEDKPKLLFQLTALLAELGLNIQEAHAFSTTDGYSLDVFVVDGWPYEETDRLRISLEKEAAKIELQSQSWPMQQSFSPEKENGQTGARTHVPIPNDGTDVWEINLKHLKFGHKIASGSYGDLYKGTYCSQEVAIKVLKPERLDSELEKEFAQEVFIMRKVRHKNVVQFIGACTKPPHLCIVTEFMPGGSVYDYLHKQKGVFKLPTLFKVAIDICKGMSYLHQNNIIHRDLKAANLLMDENEVVKVADFGVARVKAQTGVMTAETGTYRWMAPEVIEHKPYDHKADVFSYGIVLWELLTGKLPYEYMTPLQAAVGVVQKGLRPTIPKNTHPKLAELLERLWEQDSTQRPDFSEIIEQLQEIAKEVGEEGEEKKKSSTGLGGGIFAALRRSTTHLFPLVSAVSGFLLLILFSFSALSPPPLIHHNNQVAVEPNPDPTTTPFRVPENGGRSDRQLWSSRLSNFYYACSNATDTFQVTDKTRQTNRYLLIATSGGLNQQRTGIIDAVVAAYILNATLVVPKLDQKSYWKDTSNFEDIFDVDWFISHLSKDVKIIKELPKEEQSRISTSLQSMRVPRKCTPSCYLQRVLPILNKKHVVQLSKFDYRLSNNLDTELQKLRCRVNYHAVRYTESINRMGQLLVDRMRKKAKYFVALHLRFEPDMLAFSGCYYGGGQKERLELGAMRRRWKTLHAANPEKVRRHGRCPLTPEEIGLMLRGLGFGKEVHLYVASGEVYGGEDTLAPLRALFPNLHTKETLTSKKELAPFANFSSRMAALDFIVCDKSDAFVTNNNGNMARILAGRRRYLGHKVTIRPNAKKLYELFKNRHNMTWNDFSSKVRRYQTGFMGEPDEMKPGEGEFHENPASCICRTSEARVLEKKAKHVNEVDSSEYSDIGNVPIASRSDLDHSQVDEEIF